VPSRATYRLPLPCGLRLRDELTSTRGSFASHQLRGAVNTGKAVETMDTFVLKRIADDERRALSEYNRDLSQERLEWVLETCHARRQLVTMYRASRETQEAHAAYELCLAVIAELNSAHPDYDSR
jgi:hypothetical protein